MLFVLMDRIRGGRGVGVPATLRSARRRRYTFHKPSAVDESIFLFGRDRRPRSRDRTRGTSSKTVQLCTPYGDNAADVVASTVNDTQALEHDDENNQRGQ